MYQRPITIDTPGCVLFLLDQSSSMADRSRGGVSKALGVADMLNRLLSGLVGRCAQDGSVADLLHVGVLGYSTRVQSRLRGVVAPISKLQRARLGVLLPGPSDGYGRLVKKRPWPLMIWFDPASGGSTSMCAALREAADACLRFVRTHPDSLPPIVINLTDGEATDGDPVRAAHRLTSIATPDGPPLLFNFHLSVAGGQPLEYPAVLSGVRDPHAYKLFDMSSVLPDQMRAAAARMGIVLAEGARGFAYNARMDSLARFLDIGLPGAMLPARRLH
ncbi:MAG TPA: vWA domain-containing protein [Candidatus Limnocylindrales bacterium]|nr:vWA domain-containing protein [Candidatus Limnocylindrales bacterium]